uniref:Platelet-derived growth factor (PDGF) family profile domain-containing protein n=1 Tax=Latimeria chalumnae TaxID=7897 RepID=H3B058_LATCH
VMPFEEVWNRSYCRSIETLVEVTGEYPAESAHVFSPSCVSLRRCNGCCGDEKLECVPMRTRSVIMQVIRISPTEEVTQQEEMTFTEHSNCWCRPKRKRLKSERRSKPTQQRRAKEMVEQAPPPHHRHGTQRRKSKRRNEN